jgi:predicted lipoprotein with Yx(FWY)xxD motif
MVDAFIYSKIVQQGTLPPAWLWEAFMVTLTKRSFFFVPGLLILVFFLSGCGTGSAQYGSAATSATQPAAAPATKDTSSDYGKNYTTPTTAPTTAAASTTGIVVKTTSATVSGKALTILTDAKGMTLYYFKPDTASKTACTADCASTWPPLLFSSSGTPQAGGSLPGSLQVASNANGKQIVYNDHPLYTFSGDTAPGQTNGEGIAGKWFVVTTDIAKNQA